MNNIDAKDKNFELLSLVAQLFPLDQNHSAAVSKLQKKP